MQVSLCVGCNKHAVDFQNIFLQSVLYRYHAPILKILDYILLFALAKFQFQLRLAARLGEDATMFELQMDGTQMVNFSICSGSAWKYLVKKTVYELEKLIQEVTNG